MWRCPHIPQPWPGAPMVCLGAGPSLTREDVVYATERAVIVAINDAWQIAPRADVLYADTKWWRESLSIPSDDLPIYKFAGDVAARDYRHDLYIVAITGQTGLDRRSGCVRSGGHSGYQAINLAVHLAGGRPAKIVLLGYDMMSDPADSTRHHFNNGHADGSHPRYTVHLPHYATLVDPLADLHIPIVNASRQSAIDVFPRAPIQEALP